MRLELGSSVCQDGDGGAEAYCSFRKMAVFSNATTRVVYGSLPSLRHQATRLQAAQSSSRKVQQAPIKRSLGPSRQPPCSNNIHHFDMSFEQSANLESQPTTWRRQDDPTYADDPEFNAFTQQLSDKLFSASSSVTQLSRQVALLGTKRETERVRERVRDLIEETQNDIKEIGEGLKRVAVWEDMNPGQKFTQGKLNREFRASLTEFQVLQRTAIDKQRESASAARAALEDARPGSPSGQQRPAGPGQEQEQLRLADQSEVDFQENLIMEREIEIRQIEQSMGELNELFRDVAHMVHEQGEQLDLISDNVVRTRDDTRGASRELTQASRHQRNARNKACCLLIILAVVLTVVIVAVVV